MTLIEITDAFLKGAGVIGVIALLSAWLGKVWANRMFQQDRVRYETQMQTLLEQLRARSSKELFVHHLQFEKEIEVYLNLWKGVLELGRAASRFRELGVESGKPRDEELKDLENAYNRLKDRVYDYRPFYAPHVFELTKGFLDGAKRVYRIQHDARKAELRIDEVEKNLDKITNAVDVICDAIRERVFPPPNAD